DIGQTIARDVAGSDRVTAGGWNRGAEAERSVSIAQKHRTAAGGTGAQQRDQILVRDARREVCRSDFCRAAAVCRSRHRAVDGGVESTAAVVIQETDLTTGAVSGDDIQRGLAVGQNLLVEITNH